MAIQNKDRADGRRDALVDAAHVSYVPATPGDWTSGDPGTVADALDEVRGANHNLLDGSVHSDTVAADAQKGSLVYGSASAEWNKLDRGTIGQVLRATGPDIAWADVIKSFPVEWPNPVTSPTPDEIEILVVDEAIEIIHVRQHVVTGSGTVDYQIYIRDWDSSATGTTSLKTSGDFQATITGTTETGLASSGAVAAGKVLVLKAISQTGSPTLVRLNIKYKLV